MPRMWFARLHCSEDGCPTEVEVVADTLAELEALSCECGCGLQVIGFADAIDEETALAVMLEPPLSWARAA